MKLLPEDDECRSTVLVIWAILLAAMVISLGGCNMYEQSRREAIKAGLIEKQKVGADGCIWTKP